jgi:flagellar biosynthesis protein FlhB
MADDNTDKSQKTEEPTPKKIEDSRRKGQVASSTEVNHWFIIIGVALIVGVFGPGTMRDFSALFRKFIATPHLIPIDRSFIEFTFDRLLIDIAGVMLAPFGVLIALAIAAGLVQNGLLVTPEKLQPKLEKISLASGVKRLFSAKSIVEFTKGVLKITIVGAVATAVVWPELSRMERIVSFDLEQTLGLIYILALKVLIAVIAVITLIAGLDFLYQRFEFMKSMRMSRQEIKDEMKQSEGDPQIKARLRQIRQERARRRMMAAVPDASVVVANPTHYAIALKYETISMAAPVVTAKGIDHLALKIRALAEEHDIPVVENPPLARALYGAVEIDQQIPPEHFKAVAGVIGYVMRLKEGLREAYRPET